MQMQGESMTGDAGGDDSVTGATVLPRPDFLQALRESSDESGSGEYSIFLELDIHHLDWINEAYGVEAGDRAIEHVGSILLAVIGDEGLVGRIDGDEFGILLSTFSRLEAMELAAEAIERAKEPVLYGDQKISIDVRVGLSVVMQGEDPVSATLRHARHALDQAKESAVNRPVFSFWENDQQRLHRMIRRDLPIAVVARQLRLEYQPILWLKNLTVAGFEALLRWQTDDGQNVPPASFIPFAEDSGLVVPIGKWVMEEVTRIVPSITTDDGGLPFVSMNLSPRQFDDPDFIAGIEAHLAHTHVSPVRLAFELSERQILDFDRATRTLEAIRNLGCSVGLDNFGTGKSCLNYLQSMPADFIKIDGSFIRAMDKDPKAVRLVRTMTSLAHDLGLTTVAEGIETQAQYEEAVLAGCGFGQGFLFGRSTQRPDLDIHLAPVRAMEGTLPKGA
ncbi:MAG TPA: bifunctional diguanylate cyclase/phosphodiesterase [Acidimicrobiales bacterium]|jgi:diguanylate cyclase (GGDEF)-like protein